MFADLVVQLTALAGFAALIAFVINLGKVVGFVKDGTAEKWSAGLNLVGLIILFSVKIFRPDLDIEGIDQTLLQVANIGTYILGFVLQLGVSKFSNYAVKGVPIIGKSYSLDKSKV